MIITSKNSDGLFKIAFPVRFNPEEEAALRGEGIHIVNDPDVAEPNVMPGVKNRKKDIKSLVGQITLPRILYPDASHIVQIDGHQYYLVDVAEPQPKKNPTGTIYLMNLETGLPERKPFLQYADQLMSIRKEKVRQSVESINSKIQKWNDRIDKIQQVENPTTWPLQLAWATEVVDDRLAELGRMEQALAQSLDAATNFSPSYSSVLERIKGDIVAGRITNNTDLIDSILFIHNEDPDAVNGLLAAPGISEEVKGKIRNLLQMQSDASAEKKEEREVKDEERQDRIEEDTDYGVLQPGQHPLVEVKEEDINERAKKTRLPTPDQYFSPKGKANQIRAKLISIRRDKSELTSIKNSLNGLRGFIASLAKGERAKDVLVGTERGMEIKLQVADFIHKAKAFMRRYSVDVFVRDEASGSYSVNPKLFGTTGGKGNSEVAVVINQMISIVTSSLKAYASPESLTALPSEEEVFAGDAFYAPEDVP